ncbi:VWA domain-containing protein [Pseudorhodobacter aquimaris]|uniref:VWA domain-containing protein n=1 Tax=Pseudorhodobacter aquimaris TaxID=687412 RepID=UPI00067AC7B4|nr:VWA domain-containing protein [Pseudorhodobacter aquimaris]
MKSVFELRLPITKPKGWTCNRLRGFMRQEDGALLIFGIVLFVLMAMLGGLSVDLMRYEQRRTELQHTLDRSVLAAAAISQRLEPNAVVTDYFDKAGLSEYLENVSSDTGLNYRSVTASAKSTLKPFFMHLIGVDSLTPAAASGAEQRISNIEVSLVLDISGSMRGSRIDNLRPAAREFVTAVLASSSPGRVSISVVPYNAQVNIGRPMMNSFNVDAQHNHSSCIELPDSVFGSIDLSTTTKFQHNAHFDPYYTRSGASSLLYNCPPQSGNEVVTLSQSTTDLHNSINSLYADGNTSIDVGVKWGALLLNQNANSVISDMVTAGEVAATFSNRPLDADATQTLKVLVVMTDGENTTEYKINDPYNSGLSNIWRNDDTGRVSVYFNRYGDNDWWWPRTKKWNSYRDGGNDDARQLEWPEVWEEYSVRYVAQYFYATPLDQNATSWRNTFMNWVSSSKNNRLQQICSAAKTAGIVVYGIGFEAPTNGRNQLRACASTESHYFDASGLEISSAFRAIANNISQLRLTQ